MKTTQTYETIANAFTVEDIASSVLQAKASDNYIQVMERMAETMPASEFCVVLKGRQIIGYITVGDDYNKATTVGEVATPISPSQTVPSSTPILDALPLFKHHSFFFILKTNSITHVVSFLDLDKLPVKMCLIALFTELESIMQNILEWDTQIHLQHLPSSRLSQIRGLSKSKYGDEKPERLLASTFFTDKIIMFQRDTRLSKLLPFKSQDEAQNFFDLLKEMRNRVAHGNPILDVLNNPNDLNDFIVKVKRVISRLASVAT